MKETLQRIKRIVDALSKLIPTLIEIIQDLADDGKLNKSTRNPDS